MEKAQAGAEFTLRVLGRNLWPGDRVRVVRAAPAVEGGRFEASDAWDLEPGAQLVSQVPGRNTSGALERPTWACVCFLLLLSS